MRDLLRRIAPSSIDGVSAVLALYRPGPIGTGAHHDYADRKNGRQEVRPIHPELADPLADILDETFGLIVYQEQVMAIAQRVTGYLLGEADLLRRTMSKRIKNGSTKSINDFSTVCGKADFRVAAIRTLWDTSLLSVTMFGLVCAPSATWAATLSIRLPGLVPTRDPSRTSSISFARSMRRSATVGLSSH
jgi:DNA polymerase III subunit alpha